jgi:thiol-disulfide isomerase/thioredoxin
MASACLLVACLGLAGCSIFGKKSKERADSPQADAPRPGIPTIYNPGSVDRRATSEVDGILAGRVLDSYDRTPPPTFIQVIASANAKENKAAPIEVAADQQGYFTIHGLQAGQHYQLLARTREGEHKLAGSAWGTPPNARLLIYMSEDLATANTPPAPGAPVIPGQKPRNNNGRREATDSEPSNSKPANSIPSQRPVDIGQPIRLSDPSVNPRTPAQPPSDGPRSAIRPEDIAGDQRVAAVPPVANIPGNRTESYGLPNSVPSVSTQVPSCVLTGRQLDNFALNDLNGQPWEYRHHRGRITLIDFWGTWCRHCVDAIPKLRILQERYGPYGLEVIGIAYEEGLLQEQIRKVQNVSSIRGINYRVLLGGDISSCPVKTQFGINNFPTLILIDENNRIIWRAEGLDPYKLDELEILVKQQLRVR